MYIPEFEELKDRVNRIHGILIELHYLDSDADIDGVLQDIDYLRQEVTRLYYVIPIIANILYSIKDPDESGLPSLEELLIERYPYLKNMNEY